MTRRTAIIAVAVTAALLTVLAAVLLLPRSPAPTATPTANTTPPPAATAAPTPTPTLTPTASPTIDTPDPTDTRPTAVFIGDSYTVGTGTSLDGTGFPAILGELRDWRVVNLAIPGTGYSTGREDGRCPQAGCSSYIGVLPDAVALDPDIVVVSGGRNDLSRSHLEPAVVTFYTELRRQLPSARLIVTSPLWDDSPTPDELVTLREQVEREATRAGAEYIDLGDLFFERPELIAPDDLHPNEEGLDLIARRMDELMRR